MFSTPGSLSKRTGKADLNRYAYLKELVQEYKSTNVSIEKKEQVLANLGNFAYDPINYEYFRRLNILDIFMENLLLFQENKNLNLKILHFSIAAICNLCLDPKNRDYLIKNNLANLIPNCLSIQPINENVEIVLNVLTIIVFLTENIEEGSNESVEETKCQILNFKNDRVNFKSLIYELSHSANKRISNLAFLILKNLNLT
ncbi:unnamed protein product [Brachionus calyciflorus]|uniref:Armadillo repeat-containing protein 7 n=1 Tax=Brachionus calyciflorus TaxID=104777 RepID=A0A814LGC7_9BILA|nr:unnamed protein product [Brachionus calyciflorus]